ncbi:MAG: DUF4438 domain-containing protein [Candidatus Bathyarchaeota archaeon]
MLRTNVNSLVKLSLMGEVSNPVFSKSVYRISHDGNPLVLPGVGGITYNVRVGDPACGWAADHVEPGVSLENMAVDPRYGRGTNTALNILSCVGNEAIVVADSAKGEKGVVTGKHGGIEHVLIDFKPEVLEKLLPGDKILVKAYGTGLQLLDYPDIKIMNIDPHLLEALDPKPNGDKLSVFVTHEIPASIMGSGLGAQHTYSGDYDIQLFDRNISRKYGLDDLRLGDFVAIRNADHSYGRIYRHGAISVGIVTHTNCVSSGHGPGVTTLFTSSKGKILPNIDDKANLALILKLRKNL